MKKSQSIKLTFAGDEPEETEIEQEILQIEITVPVGARVTLLAGKNSLKHAAVEEKGKPAARPAVVSTLPGKAVAGAREVARAFGSFRGSVREKRDAIDNWVKSLPRRILAAIHPRNIIAWLEPLPNRLFVVSIATYLLVRLIGLTRFPAYFSFDEANTVLIADALIKNGFRGPDGEWFPVLFENMSKFSLGTTVYLQALPVLLFGRSEFVAKAVSATVSLLGAISTGLILRDIFKLRFWWLGALVLSMFPAWFLFSRTAYETTTMVSFYACALYFYLRYRQGKLNSLYLAILCAALAFYAYSPGQLLVPLTGLILAVIDFRYHWANRLTSAKLLSHKVPSWSQR